MSARSARSTKLSACRRRSSDTIGGWLFTVETTVTRLPCALHGLHQLPEIAVAREQHHVVGMLGHLQHVDGDLDVHVAAEALAPVPSTYSRAALVTSR